MSSGRFSTVARPGVIICLDDEAMILTSLREQLRPLSELGLSVEVSTDGADALSLLRELLEEGEEVPLFISDQIMPGLKGDEVLKEVHAISPRTRSILLTGQADLDAVQRAVNEANLYRYISKPWEQADLMLTARAAIESYAAECEIQAQQRRLRATNEVFKRFVPEPFLRRIATQGLTDIVVGHAEQLELTILFSDIRGFTTLAESMRPAELLQLLNSYFEALSEPIHQVGGFIDKFIGDAIMAIFDGEAHARRAVEAAMGMMRALESWNRGRDQPLSSGIGLHTGEVVIGTVGTTKRMDSTVLGDAVNLASRLEGLTKTHGSPLIASEATVKQATHAAQASTAESTWRAVSLGETQVKGRHERVRYFKIISAEEAGEERGSR